MQPCKLNESESRPDIALRMIGQELDKAETKCFTLKSELNYVMDVCRKAQTERRSSKEAFNVLPMISSFRSPGSKFSIEHSGCNSEIASIKTANCNVPHRSHNVELKAEENFGDAFNLSPRSARFSSGKCNDNDDITGRSENLIERRQKGSLNVTIAPRRARLDKKPSIMAMPTQGKITEADKEYESYYFPSSVSLEKLSSQEDYYLHVTPCVSARGDVEDTEDVEDPRLNLDTPNDNARTRRAIRSSSRTGRSEIGSVCRTGNAMSKARKRKANKLRGSASKSTVATKDTSLVGRKEAKRRRHKGHASGVVHQQSSHPKQLKRLNDVVEIFHNAKLKSSNSGISSKHSKIDGAKYEKKKPQPSRIVERRSKDEEPSREGCSRVDDESRSYENKKNDQVLQTLNCQNNSRTTPRIAEKRDKLEEHPASVAGSSARDGTRQCERPFSQHPDDPMFVPSYGMPTLASKLKRSSRSYLSRFNFRSIPFVVGTSVTPSHNLGLNIQQVLSVMKTRQPIASDVTPLLIRKVSRGIRPVSILLDRMSGRHDGSAPDVSSPTTGTFDSGENPARDGRSSAFNSQHARGMQSGCVSRVSAEAISEEEGNVSKQLRKGKGDSCDRRTKLQRSSFAAGKSDADPQNQEGISRMSLKDNIGDHKIRIPDSHNSKEMRDVLINLHDQFEEMNIKYERLRSEVDRSNDKSLAKELSALEKELNAKEEEINAVVGLYKEVTTLKRQMKMLHGQNGLVCIATESARETCQDPFPWSITPGKSQSMNPAQIVGQRKVYSATREPPVSLQLAALLRKIQTFHKQLQLVS